MTLGRQIHVIRLGQRRENIQILCSNLTTRMAQLQVGLTGEGDLLGWEAVKSGKRPTGCTTQIGSIRDAQG